MVPPNHPETAKQPQTITLFGCWYAVLFMKFCTSFMLDVTESNLPESLTFCLISPYIIFTKVFKILKMFLTNISPIQAVVFFWSAVFFSLEIFHGCHFSWHGVLLFFEIYKSNLLCHTGSV